MADTTTQTISLPIGPNKELVKGTLITNKNGDAEWYAGIGLGRQTTPTFTSNANNDYKWQPSPNCVDGVSCPTQNQRELFYTNTNSIDPLNNARLKTFNSPSGFNSPQLAKQLKVPGSNTAAPPSATPPSATPPVSSPDPQTNPQFFDGSVPYGGDPVTATADPNYPLMYYPLKNRQDGTFDYLKVSAYRFLESGLRTDAQNFSVISTEDRRKSKAIGTVFLPMQPGISDTNGVSWNEDSLNPFQAALGGVAAKTISVAGSGDVVNAARGLAQGLINTGQNIANNKQLQNYIAAYFAGQAVGTNLVARTTGTVLNNNLELLFNGPKLRSFRYSYRFTPREKEESEMIRKIIRFFKREMSAEKVAKGLFLASPNVFKLEYISKNNPNEFLNKIKFCALTDMSVNYTPDGSYMTYQDGSMTSYEVEFQFSELEPIYKNDYDSPTGLQGMGY